jgi:hypothetical protein
VPHCGGHILDIIVAGVILRKFLLLRRPTAPTKVLCCIGTISMTHFRRALPETQEFLPAFNGDHRKHKRDHYVTQRLRDTLIIKNCLLFALKSNTYNANELPLL